MRSLFAFLVSISLLAITSPGACAQQQQEAAPQEAAPQQEAAENQPLSEADIDTLLAPIALYPDPLIAQILPAATYPDDIQAAANWLAQNPNDPNGIDAQSWDLSVKAVAHYPQVIEKLAGDMDWTLALGQAYTLQQEAVMQSIQRLREMAKNAGTLADTPQQSVVTEQDAIRIVPAQPEVIYVPQYDPEVVYVAGPAYRPGLLAFTSGFLIGAWLNSDLDWRLHRVYYHGWVGPGWISHSRPHVRLTNRYYVNDSYRSRAWVNPAFRARPMPVNRNYITRHENRYEFNRNRATTGAHGGQRRTLTPMERIDAARRRGSGSRATPMTNTVPSGRVERRSESRTGHVNEVQGGRLERRVEPIITRPDGAQSHRVERRTERPVTSGAGTPAGRVERRTESTVRTRSNEARGPGERRHEATATATTTEQKQREKKKRD